MTDTDKLDLEQLMGGDEIDALLGHHARDGDFLTDLPTSDEVWRMFATLKSQAGEIERLEKAKQSMFHSLHEIAFYEGGAESALQDEYVMERLAAIIDEHKEPCDIDAIASPNPTINKD